MKKLIIDARMLKSSGIGVYLEAIISGMIGINILCLIRSIDKKFFMKRNIPFRVFDCPIYSIREQFKFRSLIGTTDVFWSPHYNVPLFPIRCERRVVTIHDVYHLAHLSKMSFVQQAYAKILMKRAIQSDEIITVSNFSKNEIIKYTGCHPDKITVIYNGVNNMFSEPINISLKYNLPEKFLLFVGNVKPHKNLKVLCLAYLNLPLELQRELKIVIVGKKDGFITGDQELLTLINESSVLSRSIVFTGFVDAQDMPLIYNKALVFIFPSLYEGFGLPPLEAMANSTPVICSNIPSLKEVCEEAAIFFDPSDPIGLAKSISKMLDPVIASTYIALGLNHARNFTWEKSFNKHLQVFNL